MTDNNMTTNNRTTAVDIRNRRRERQGQDIMQQSNLGVFCSIQAFEDAQRMGSLLASSKMIPRRFENNLGACVVAIDIAQRVQMSPIMVMQNLYEVYGTFSWSGAYCISAINASGLFSEPLRFVFVGKEGEDSWGCRAVTKSHSGEEIEGPKITIGLAKAEGWYHKKDSKWPKIPELMLRYRAGAWFARTECPQILMGMKTAEEVNDIIDINPKTGEIINSEELAGGPSKPTVHTTTVDKIREGGTGKADQTKSAENQQQEEQPDDPADYPKQLPDETWIDINGAVWNEDEHGWSRANNAPSVNQDGTFRAKRGTGGASGDEDPEQQDAQGNPNDDAPVDMNFSR